MGTKILSILTIKSKIKLVNQVLVSFYTQLKYFLVKRILLKNIFESN